MRLSFRLLGLALLVMAIFGCGGGQQAAQESSVDSLLAANPTEQTPGDITPQTEFEQTPAPEAAPKPKPAAPKPKPAAPKPQAPAPDPGVTLSAGTPIKIAVAAAITSETALPGDTWSGTVQEPVIVGDRVAIPAGSLVSGVVSGTKSAEKGSRAFLVLSVKSIEANGKTFAVSASADSIIAGSTRARNVGAVVGGTAAGALLGKAIGGSGKGALIGGLIGGAAATGAVAASKGYQVVVKEGAEMTFAVNNSVTMR